jgi:hypothetical protein
MDEEVHQMKIKIIIFPDFENEFFGRDTHWPGSISEDRPIRKITSDNI